MLSQIITEEYLCECLKCSSYIFIWISVLLTDVESAHITRIFLMVGQVKTQVSY